MQLQPNTLLQGGKYKYKIERVLGQGGFGITYLATTKLEMQGPLGMIETEIKVAIKEFFMKELCDRDHNTSHVSVGSIGSRELVNRFRKKFIKEANNIAALQHPSIVKVLEVFEENGTAYYVMEYIEGCSLQEWLKQRGALPEQEALDYIRQVSSALDYIHRQKMNHLDVKPANILRRENGNVVLIDFGLSKQYDEKGEQTSSTPVGVSAGYAPIEQSKPGGVGQFSAPTDIYSLGATLYKLVTGQTPPDASDVVNDGISIPAGISNRVAVAIRKAMEPSRRNRPQTITEFLTLLVSREEEETIPVETEETRIEDKPKNPYEEKDQSKKTVFPEPTESDINTPPKLEIKETDNKKGLPNFLGIIILAVILIIAIWLYISYTNDSEYLSPAVEEEILPAASDSILDDSIPAEY
ncbi:serine/threonine protein kinase [Parabacteroides pacaensis]|uniref:serine/threonine protein kinase n=1 Tax=Parabacteroides pacaensis TaxID=2086575 RepID=UPI000D10953C|nr:serine/threonine-protein kinase [Parabacteroides pacaensis]